MKGIKAKDILIPTVALFAICLVASVLLGLTNSVTAPKIAEQEALAVQNSLKEVLTEVNGEAVASFGDEKKANDNGSITYYDALSESGTVLAKIYVSSAKGYGGDVKVMTAFDENGTILGFTVVDCSTETPGLGQNAKTHFERKLDGKSGELVVDKYSNEGQNVQAITAATITSKAVVAAINAAAEINKTLFAEGGQSNG